MIMTNNPESTFEALEKVIFDTYKGLPKNQKLIADFILKSPNEAAFLSVIEIGDKCGVSKATVVRFAQSIGFNGFLEFRNALQSAVHKKYTYMDRLPSLSESDKDTIFEVAKQDVENINQTIEAIHPAEFNQIINLIRNAKCINTYGLGISALMADILAYSLNQVAVKAQSTASAHLTFEEQLMFMGSDDLLVVFSFPPYSKGTIEAARLAFEKKVPVVAITDSPNSPAARFAVNKLIVKSENLLFTNSFAAISVIINAITTEISVRDKVKTLRFIKQINGMLNKGGHFELE